MRDNSLKPCHKKHSEKSVQVQGPAVNANNPIPDSEKHVPVQDDIEIESANPTLKESTPTFPPVNKPFVLVYPSSQSTSNCASEGFSFEDRFWSANDEPLDSRRFYVEELLSEVDKDTNHSSAYSSYQPNYSNPADTVN